MAYNDYKVVTPVGTENPAREGWYEKSGSTYFKTTDTTIQGGKTYYQRGFLVKVGNYTIPFRYIKYETYQALWSVVDFDSYRDADGELHRDAVSDRRTLKVEWETPDMSDTEFEAFMSSIRAQFTSAKAKSCNVTAWVPEMGAYKSDKCYLTSDVNVTIRYADSKGLRYNPIRLAFIGYNTSSAT